MDNVKRLIISFLGANDNVYKEVIYSLGEKKTAEKRKFVQVAICELLEQDKKPEEFIVFLTEGARSKSLDSLKEEWNRVINKTITEVSIPDGASEKELWEIFNSIGNALKVEAEKDKSKKIRLIIDITHGFRALPVSMILAIQFFKNIYGFEVESVFYGAFDPQKHKTCGESYCAPIFDLTPMMGLVDWSESVVEWKRTGRADTMTEKMVKLKTDLKSEYRDKLPFEDIINGFNIFNAALDLTKVDDIINISSNIMERLEEFISDSESFTKEWPMVSPVKEILYFIKNDIFITSKVNESDLNKASIENIKSMLNLARWYLKRNRIVETYSIIRETMVMCAVYIIKSKTQVDFIENRENTDTFRENCYDMLRSVCSPESYSDPGDCFGTDKERIMKGLREWLRDKDEFRVFYKKLEDRIGKRRNSILHCFFGKNEKLNWKEPLKNFIEDAEKFISDIEKLLEMIENQAGPTKI
ncbi:MAG: TIGR02221 family CRISPR-associated protein [Deltaproteobacteria bacterium]|nr:TIGR02221 family CRISPR-associated protein [Deltaproteobacteria bacterium]